MYPYTDKDGNNYRILEDGSKEYENFEEQESLKASMGMEGYHPYDLSEAFEGYGLSKKSSDDGSKEYVPREEHKLEGYHPYDLSEAFKGYGLSKPKLDRTIDDDKYFDVDLVHKRPTDEQGNPQKSLIDILSGSDVTDNEEDGASAGSPIELPSMIGNTEGETSPATTFDLEDFLGEFPGKVKDIASKGWEGIKGIASDIGEAVSDYGIPSKIDIYDFDPYHAERYYMALLQIDPAMAEGYKDMYTKRKELEKKKTDTVYTPEQKRLIDAKEQNRIEMGKAIGSANTAQTNKDEKSYNYWMKQVDSLKANDERLRQALVASGLNEYASDSADNLPKLNGNYKEDEGSGENGSPDSESNYEKAKTIVNATLNIIDGYSTKDNKVKALKDLNDFNAKLGKFPLTDEELTSLKNIIESAKLPAGPTNRPTNTAKDWIEAIKQNIKDLALASNVSTLDPMKSADAQILWKVQQREFSPEAVNEGDLNLGRDWFTKAVSSVTGIPPTIPPKEAAASKELFNKKYRNAEKYLTNEILSDTNKKYISEGTYNWVKTVLANNKWIGKGSTPNPSTPKKRQLQRNPKTGKLEEWDGSKYVPFGGK